MFEGFESGLFGFAGISMVIAFLFGVARGTKTADRFTHRMFGFALGLVGLILIARAFQWLPSRQIAMFGSAALVACAVSIVVVAERSRRRFHSG